MNVIQTNHVKKVYEGAIPTVALKDINIQIKNNSITAIIGQSGSGKSTLLNILGTLDTATSGDVIIDGKNISQFSREDLAAFRNETIGFVFQFHYLLPEFSVLENVLMPHNIGSESNKNKRKRAEELLHLVGIGDLKDKASTDISGGQKQRVAIARALMNNPKIILADEPTGNLDSETSSKILDLFKTINKEEKTTFVLITHDDRIAARADEIIELKDGEIVRK